MNEIAAKDGNELINMEDSSVMDMARHLNEMRAKLELTKQFFKQVMEKDVDYGTIPGTQKPSLLQPGADKLIGLYNLAKMIDSKEETKDYQTGHYDVTVKVQLVHRASQVIAGEGEGCCSTRESKYRFRWVPEWEVPSGVNKDILTYKEKPKRDGGGTYKLMRIENEDLFSQWNTVLKMATKRAYISAVLSSTGLSGLFSQDEDDLNAWMNGDPEGTPGKDPAGNKKHDKPSGRSGSGNTKGGSEPANKIEQQKNAISAIGKRQGLSPEEINALVLLKTEKEMDSLTSDEAGTFIAFLQKTEAAQLKAMLEDPASASNEE